jgi:phage RecT family recombinase
VPAHEGHPRPSLAEAEGRLSCLSPQPFHATKEIRMSSTALKAAVTSQVTQQRTRTIFDYLDDPRVKSGIAAVAGKFLAPDRMLRLCVNAVKKTPLLLQCDPQTVLGAMMTSAALGLEPNTIQQQAFLIPYKKRAKVGNNWVDVYECQFQVGARGFVTLAYRSPHIRSLAAEAVHEGDVFEHMQGSKTFLNYSKAMRDRGDLIGAWSHVALREGGETACILPLDEILKIRDKSETFRALVRGVERAESPADKAKAQQKLDEAPWVMWIDDMASKSAIKKHAKLLPIASGDALLAAADIDNHGDAGSIDLAAMTDPDAVRSVVAEGAEPPALEHSEPEVLEPSGEAYATRERVPAQQDQAATPAPARGRQRPEAKQAAPAPSPAEPRKDLHHFVELIDNAVDGESAQAITEQAREHLTETEYAQLAEAFEMAWKA